VPAAAPFARFQPPRAFSHTRKDVMEGEPIETVEQQKERNTGSVFFWSGN
jgi:hypothetical protein